MSERVIQHPVVNMSATIRLTEVELAALLALAGYGSDGFLTVFYERLGRSYLEPHEAGVRSLFKTASDEIPLLLQRAKAAREAFSKAAQ